MRIIAGENVSGLAESSLSVSSGSIVSLEGQNSVWTAVVRPPETAAVITFTVATDAVDQGNVETEKDIRISTSFPDTDAEAPTQLFNTASAFYGLAVSPTRLILALDSTRQIVFYDHDGNIQTSETLTLSASGGRLDYINGSFLSVRNSRYPINSATSIETYGFTVPVTEGPLVHTRLGILKLWHLYFQLLPYGKTAAADIIEMENHYGTDQTRAVAHQSDLLYSIRINNSNSTSRGYALSQITDNDTIVPLAPLNIFMNSGSEAPQDIAIYGDTLYIVNRMVDSRFEVGTLNIRPYRPMALNTKTRIDVQFIDEGGTLPLTPFAPDAETFTFATGFDKPTYLSINSSQRNRDSEQCRHRDTTRAGKVDGYQLH